MTPGGAAVEQIPTFIGWNRYDWSVAPEPLIDHFGMPEAWEGWQAEHLAMDEQMAEISARIDARADAIIEQCGDVAREIMRTGGTIALFQEYEKDTTLGRKRRKSVTVAA